MSKAIELVEQIKALEFPPDLPYEDGEPLESNWHRIQINLLVDLTHQLWSFRDDYFAGGNMFVYFSAQQVTTHAYRGPDFFLVKEVVKKPERRSWKTWEEDGRFPDLIIELLSPATARTDLTTKKRLYERTFRTPEYFAYDKDTRQLYGWRLGEGVVYHPLLPNERGWLWSEELQVWLGEWEGEYERVFSIWLRFYTREGQLVPTGEEAQAAARREAEAEVAFLRAELARLRGETK
ncbi:Uma2 family endonuclease [Candidatus Poribacteria bacterium]|nr:Uma2 family endonuclease [Candidatus Poribacteria bacterium]